LNKPARILPMQQEQESLQMKPQSAAKTSKQTRSFRWRRLFLIGFTAWAGYVFFFVQAPNLSRLNQMQSDLNGEVKQATQNNKELQKQIQQLQDPDYIAELARKKYMMVKDGETLFVESKPQ
jgi:cell division protein DivIC